MYRARPRHERRGVRPGGRREPARPPRPAERPPRRPRPPATSRGSPPHSSVRSDLRSGRVCGHRAFRLFVAPPRPGLDPHRRVHPVQPRLIDGPHPPLRPDGSAGAWPGAPRDGESAAGTRAASSQPSGPTRTAAWRGTPARDQIPRLPAPSRPLQDPRSLRGSPATSLLATLDGLRTWVPDCRDRRLRDPGYCHDVAPQAHAGAGSFKIDREFACLRDADATVPSSAPEF